MVWVGRVGLNKGTLGRIDCPPHTSEGRAKEPQKESPNHFHVAHEKPKTMQLFLGAVEAFFEGTVGFVFFLGAVEKHLQYEICSFSFMQIHWE